MDDKTLLDLFGSLSREIGEVKREVSQVGRELKDGFNRTETRLARQGGILNGGARQVARLIEWSERVDQILTDRDERIAELTRRVNKLEGKQEPG